MSSHSAEEQAFRQQLAAAYRLLPKFGLDELTFTHASVRLPGPERNILLNPYGLLFDEITASNLVKIDLNGTLLGDNGQELSPSAFPVHSAIHAGRDDALAVIHLHTVAGSAIAAQKDGLLMLNQISMSFLNRIGYHNYRGITYSKDERDSFIADLGHYDAMIMRNHGLLTVGKTVGQAFIRMYYLHMACQIKVQSLAGGRELVMPDEEVCELVARQWAGTAAGKNDAVESEGGTDRAWKALVRKLGRTDPKYLE
jgi:ribulose-5-phosphate 4-epimerase/fuculose-1-phosphate aldolase